MCLGVLCTGGGETSRGTAVYPTTWRSRAVILPMACTGMMLGPNPTPGGQKTRNRDYTDYRRLRHNNNNNNNKCRTRKAAFIVPNLHSLLGPQTYRRNIASLLSFFSHRAQTERVIEPLDLDLARLDLFNELHLARDGTKAEGRGRL